ncbi:hypothetical protein HPG69_005124 [Diceros bicornis minor]|uniref:Uncharacterized protein n=1 Tax=Diceros bicornis minor TaxID=77932 RepID=A0A7J7EG09_DICBM|nr:hypothetical protein HPG69_005124 [Diceros bicornis minor]
MSELSAQIPGSWEAAFVTPLRVHLAGGGIILSIGFRLTENGEPSSTSTEISGNLRRNWPNIKLGAGRGSRKRQQEEAAGSRNFFSWCPGHAKADADELG